MTKPTIEKYSTYHWTRGGWSPNGDPIYWQEGDSSVKTQYTYFKNGQSNPITPDGFRASGNYYMEDGRYTPIPTTERSSASNGYEIMTGVQGTETYWWDLFSYPHGEICQSEWNRSVTECLLKLGDQKAQVGQFLAEAKESANMLATAAGDFANALLAIRRGRIPPLVGRGGILGDVANGWLQWNYGWKPLASDLYSLWELSKGSLDHPLTMTASRRITSHWEDNSNKTYWMNRQFKANVTDITKLCAKVNPTALRYCQQIGVTNPLSLAWELIPYSFVVDWFLPIGSYLSALTATQGLDFVWGYSSQWNDMKVDAYRTIPDSHTGLGEGISVSKKQYNRQGYTAFPAPLPYVKPPFSTSHTLSALALIKQLF